MNSYGFYLNNEEAYIHSTDPVIDAERSFDANERRYWRHIAKNARCAICGAIIEDDECTVLTDYDAFETSICPECTADQLKKAKAVLDPMIYESFEEIIAEFKTKTPNAEDGTGSARTFTWFSFPEKKPEATGNYFVKEPDGHLHPVALTWNGEKWIGNSNESNLNCYVGEWGKYV